MTIAEASACCAALDVRAWNSHVITNAVLGATTALLAASPQITPVASAPGVWWVGASGFGALGGEPALANTLLAIARQWHPDARVAIASSCIAARAATWTSSPAHHPPPPQITTHNPPPTTSFDPPLLTIIPPGRCAAYLAPAPLGLVPMSEDLREALHLLGIRTVGALASLDPGDVEQRWSREGLSAWRLARGEDPRRPGLTRVEATRSTSVELPGTAESAGPVLFVLRAQLQRLLEDCVRDGRAAAAVAITLILDAGRQYPIHDIATDITTDAGTDAGTDVATDTTTDITTDIASNRSIGTPLRTTPTSLLAIPQRTITREVRPARPLARLEPLFEQCRALLDQWTIPAPIIGVTVSIPATAPLAADQGDLLVPSWRDAAMNAEAVFARLRAVLDPDHRGDVVVHPEARDTHRLEESGRWMSADAVVLASAPISTTTTSTLDTVPVTLRLINPPEAVNVEVEMNRHSEQRPNAIHWRGQRLSCLSIHGPEQISGDWWRGDGYTREYWRCLTETDGELLLYRAEAQWYLHGWYD